MAGHYPLCRIEEPKLFALADSIASKLAMYRNMLPDFHKAKTPHQSKQYEYMLLSDEYAEEENFAVTLGKVTLQTKDIIEEQWEALWKDISVEVHINKKTKKVVSIFWVA
jgi:hypothetical protein